MLKENIKLFFGSLWKGIIARIALGVVLFGVVIFIHAITWPVADYGASGWPFSFSESWGPGPPNAVCHDSNPLALIADAVLWYLVLCSVIFVLGKIRNKKFVAKEQKL